MASLIQMETVTNLMKEGWLPVVPPFDIHTPIGGPTIMINSRCDVIRVYADGSIVRMVPEPPNDK